MFKVQQCQLILPLWFKQNAPPDPCKNQEAQVHAWFCGMSVWPLVRAFCMSINKPPFWVSSAKLHRSWKSCHRLANA